MSGIKSTTFDNIEIIHHSTPSLYEVIVNTEEEVEYGVYRDVKNRIWLSYSDFDNLLEAMFQIKQ